jgi:pimeloyl-ACP methyl ester carboxylesterase
MTRLLLLLAALLGGCAGMVRAGERSIDRKLARHDLTESSVTLGPDTLHVWQGGQGTPLVLVHGFGGSAALQWHALAGRLAEHHRLVMADLLWFGDSTSTRRAFGLDHQVEALAALLRHLDIEGARVVGTSYGGFVAWDVAHAHPELVSDLVLIDSPGPAFDRSDYAKMLQRLHARDAIEIFVPDDVDDMRRLLELGYRDPPRVPSSLLAAFQREVYAPHATEHRELLRRLVHDRLESAPEIVPPKQPVTLIWGAHDPVFPIADARELADAIDSELIVIDDARHAPMLEHPDRVAEVVLRR